MDMIAPMTGRLERARAFSKSTPMTAQKGLNRGNFRPRNDTAITIADLNNR
jgi:hypothetical protein